MTPEERKAANLTAMGVLASQGKLYRRKCNWCDHEIAFLPTTNSNMPVDEDGTPHFATCPNYPVRRGKKSSCGITTAEFINLIFVFSVALFAFAQRQAIPITNEQVMQIRVKTFRLSDYRIAMALQECVTTGRMNYEDARRYVAANEGLIRQLTAASANDPK